MRLKKHQLIVAFMAPGSLKVLGSLGPLERRVAPSYGMVRVEDVWPLLPFGK